MKRVGNLYEKMLSDENILKAIDEVNKSHRWCHYPDKPNKLVLWVESTKEERVKELRRIIINGFTPSPGTEKRRYDRNARKWRDIYEPRLYPDQYVHHILIGTLEPVMLRGMDHWCCGSIKKRGAHYGIRAIKKWMKEDKKGTRYCAELDIRHFYDSIKPKYVIDRLRRLIKDEKVIDLAKRVTSEGIKIGCYCSQWFANTLLQPLDRIIRENGATRYVRYLDNFTIFCNRKKTLHKIKNKMEKWLNNHELKLKGNWQIFPCGKRKPNALGYKYGRGITVLRKHTLLTLKRQLRKYYKMKSMGRKINVKFAQGLLSRFGMLAHCYSKEIFKSIRPKTQRELKDIVREWQRKERKEWNMFLEQYNAEMVSKNASRPLEANTLILQGA